MCKEESCTGATGKTGKELAYYRLLKSGRKNIFAIFMNENELSERRIFLRKIFVSSPEWNKLSNEELEDIRVYDCSSGYIVEDVNGYQYVLPTAEKRVKEESEFRKVRAMIPFEFLDISAKDFDWSKYKSDTAKVKDMVNTYILKYPQFKEKGMGLYIYSRTKGSGKTMLACCLINEIIKRHPGSVKFVNVLDFIEMTKNSYKGNDEIDAIYSASLLVLDDLGVQLSKEWVDTVLYRLVNERYTKRLPVIYTSNIPVEKLKIDDRIIDRIESTTYQIELPEESVRREMRKQEKFELLKSIKNAPSGTTNTE